MISVSSSHFEQLTHPSTQIIKNPTRFVLPPFVNSDLMDFHSLTRRELQSLCKLNKIPANITNVAMADKLQSLEIVEGIEKFFKVSQSETAALVGSTKTVDVSSPKVTSTRCRTTTRQKVKITEAENLPITSTRTTRRGSKQVAKVLKEPNNDMLQTPALSSSKRKTLAASSCQNLNSQLNDEEEGFVDPQSECKPSSPEKAVTINRRKGAATSTTMKRESNVQKKTYNSRRSTRLTEKKSGEPRVKKESEKAVKINSLLDEVNVTSEEVLSVEVLETTCAGNPDELVNLMPESDEITNPHEDGDLEEKLKIGEKFDHGEEDSSEVIDINQESDKISNPSCENVDLEGEELNLGHKFDVSEVMVPEEQSDMVLDDNADIKSELEEEGMYTTDINEGSENMVDEPHDVIPTIDVVSTIAVEVEDLKPEVLSEKNDAECLICSSVEENSQISHPTGVTQIKTSVSKKDMEKTPALSRIRKKAPATPSSHNVTSGLNDCQEECLVVQMPDSAVKNSGRSSATMEKESEQVVEINSFLDDVKVTSGEILHVEIPEKNTGSGNPDAILKEDICDTFEKLDVVAEEKEDSGEVENLNPELEGKPEADDISNQSENVDLEEEELELAENLNACEFMVLEDSDANLSVELGQEKKQVFEKNDNPSTVVTPMNDKSDCNSAVTNSERSSFTMKKEWKEIGQVVESNLLLEVTCDDEVSEKSTGAKLADICNTFEKLDVAVEEKEVSGEVRNLKLELHEIKNPNENGCLFEEEKTKEASDDVNSNNPQEFMFCADLETNNDAEMLSLERESGEEEDMFCGDSEKFEIATYFEEKKGKSSMGKNVDEEKKKISSLVPDDKENMKKKDEMRSLSIRQLRKQIKALTLKTINNNEDTTSLKEGTGRAALQALCENRMV